MFFEPSDTFVLILRFVSVIQLCTILPIIYYVIRTQFFGTFFEDGYPSVTHVAIYCVTMVVTSLMVLYFFYNMLGKLMSFIGATTGFILIYIVPLVVNTVYYQVKHPTGLKREELLSIKNEDDLPHNEIFKGPHNFSKKPESKVKLYLFYTSQVVLVLFGLFTVVIQFTTINFFDVNFSEVPTL